MTMTWDVRGIVALAAFTLLALAARSIFSVLHAHILLRNVPGPPVNSWLSGHVGLLQNSRWHRVVQDTCRRLGGVIALRLYWRPVCAIKLLFLC